MRLMWATVNVTWLSHLLAIILALPPAGSFPLQRVVIADVSMPNVIFGFQTANTICFPRMSPGGIRIANFCNAADAVIVSRFVSRQNRAAIATWIMNGVIPFNNLISAQSSVSDSVWSTLAARVKAVVPSHAEELLAAQTLLSGSIIPDSSTK